MKNPYKIYRILGMGQLRALCVQRNWYTQGDNAEYSHMLNMANKSNLTSDDILEIALDIIAHSDLESNELLNVCDAILGCTYSFMM